MNVKKNSPRQKTEILIVEDSRTQAEQLKHILEKHHYMVAVANDGKQALSLFSEHKPALVISDIIMPEMNGYELCKSIKTNFGDEEIPVILLTSLSDAEDVLEGLACGADNFITKPYSEDYILSSISQILANRFLRKVERVRIGVEIVFAGKRRFITAEHQQMLTLLLSSYDAAVHKNKELTQTQETLKLLNENLEELVKKRTAALSEEIKECKRAEEALAESEKKHRALFETISEGIVYEDYDGKIISANPAAERLLGLSLDQMRGRTSLDPRWKAIHEDGSPFPGETHSLNVAAKTGKPATDEVMGIYNQKSGAYVWLSVNSTPEFLPEEKKPFRAYAVFRDISERKRTEEALVIKKKISEIFLTKPGDEMYYEVLQIVLEVMKSPFGVFGYIDEDGANVVPSMTRLIWDNCKVPQKTMTFPRETWGDSSWPRAIREKKPNYSNERSNKVPEGHVPIERHVSLPILHQGEVIGLFQVANKETRYTEADMRLLETISQHVAPILSARLQRRRHEKRLQEKHDELIRFTYTVSHDLKSPLVTIRTFLGYLEQDMRKPEAAAVDQDLAYIRNATDKASRMLDELLELSRIGRKVNPPVEVPLQEIVKEALALVAGQIAERGVTVKVTKDPIQLFGDRPRLVEVFQNLVDNAVKFMGRERAPHVEIGVDEVGGETVLFVRDNGIGIKPEYQTKLFGLFEKLDPGTEGTGVGLALVARIVEVHGGRIWVESEGPGKGATFRFTLAKTKRKPA